MEDQNPKPQVQRRVGKNDIIPASIDQHHMAAKHAVLIMDKASNRPTTGNPYCQFFFATDTLVLSVWTGKVWKSTSALT